MTDDRDQPQPAPGVHRATRSPSYPSIDLGLAVQRVERIGELSLRHPVPLEAIAKSWGLSRTSSNIPKVIASLKHFGLAEAVDDTSSRQVRLTDAARDLLFHSQDREGDEWRRLVQAAARKPQLYEDLITEFGLPLPASSVVEHFLVHRRNFGTPAAHDCVLKLERTIEFARLDSEDTIVGGPPEAGILPDGSPPGPWASPPVDPSDPGMDPPRRANDFVQPEPIRESLYAPVASQDRTAVQIPYSPGGWATLQAAFPMTEGEWRALTSMLQAMKPGLVQSQEAAAVAPPEAVAPPAVARPGAAVAPPRAVPSAAAVRTSAGWDEEA